MRVLQTIMASLIGCIVAGSAAAHDDHDAWHPVYETWMRPDGNGSCCNRHDCKPVAHRDSDAGIEIRIDELGGRWYPVPRKAILPFSSFNADAHACYIVQWCFDGGSRVPCRADIRCVALPMAM